MAAMTSLDSRLVARIKELVDAGKLFIRAVGKDDTFIACNAGRVFSYDAVLHISTNRRHIVFDKKNRPSDILARVAEVLTKEAQMYGKID